jgi:predicted phage terminase large subunit-like protein
MPLTREKVEYIIKDPKENKMTAIILASDFQLFIRYVHFAINDAEFTFKPFHLKVIKALEDIEFSKNKKRNLALCLPVGSGKSLIVEYFIAWSFCRNINKAFLYTSHSMTNIMKLSREVKDMFEHEFLMSLYKINLKHDERSKINWSFDGAMNRTGLVAKPTGAGLTGADAGHRAVEGFSGAVIIDDPLDAEKRNSEIALADVISFYDNKLSTRRRTPTTPSIVIMQRLSLKDLVGWIKENEEKDWDIIEVPALDEAENSFWPEIYPNDELKHIRTINPEKFYAQYQQNPIAGGNAILRREWFKYYKEMPEFDSVIQSWDTAFKKGEKNDYSVCTTWGMKKTQFGNNYYLIDVWRDKAEYPELKSKFIALQNHYNPSVILVEDKASGQSLLQELRNIGNQKLKAIKVDSDKETRMHAITSLFEQGSVLFPENSNFMDFVLDELLQFPNGAHDDVCDSITQYLNYMNKPRNEIKVLRF